MGNSTEFTRQELFDLVWSEPMVRLAAKYDPSDRGLAKLCARHGIPLPPPGHWQLRPDRRMARRPKLRNSPNDAPEPRISLSLRRLPDPEDPRVLEWRLREGLPENRIVVRTAESLHPLIAAISRSKRARSFGAHGFERPTKAGEFDIRVTAPLFERAVSLGNTLACALEARGMLVTSGTERQSGNQGCTMAHVFGHQIPFRIQEKLKQVRRGTGTINQAMTLEPTGRLSIQIDQYADGIKKLWVDSEASPVEDHLNEVVLSLIRISVFLDQRQRAEEQRLAAVRRAEEAAAAEAEAARLEADRRAAIENQVGQWVLGNDILSFVGEARRWLATSDVSDQDGAGLSGWYDWAERYAKTLIRGAQAGGAPAKGEGPSVRAMLVSGQVPRATETTLPVWHPNLRWYHKR